MEQSWSVISELRCSDGTIVSHQEEYDAVICASGKNVPVPGFERRSLDAKMSIAITANFINKNSPSERRVTPIPGLSKQYDQQFFQGLESKHGIRLENIVYYKDSTHYFVMTAKRTSLLSKGVLKKYYADRSQLLNYDNIDQTSLEKYAREAATYATNHFSQPLPDVPFAQMKSKKDVSIFDFTNLYSTKNACRVRESGGHRLLLARTVLARRNWYWAWILECPRYCLDAETFR